MKAVKLKVSHGIELLFDELGREEMARTVEHHTAIRKARLVIHLGTSHLVAVYHQLSKGLQGIKQACCGMRHDGYSFGRYV